MTGPSSSTSAGQNVIVTKKKEHQQPQKSASLPAAKPAIKTPKTNLMDVMREEKRRSDEEAAARAIYEAEMAAERERQRAQVSWGAPSSMRAPTLREIMEMEAKREAEVAKTQPQQEVRSLAQERSGWAPWGAASAPKSLREIQAEEEKGRSKKAAAAAQAPAPVAVEEEFFWGQKAPVVANEDFPALPGASKPKGQQQQQRKQKGSNKRN